MGHSVTKTRIHSGHWEGVITASRPEDKAPEIEVTHLDRALGGVKVAADAPGRWNLRIPIPAEVRLDGGSTS